ncbi:MAG TPA: ABC transporter permease [Usitatibacter sp.]|jgi:tungstate transport system permease protein
MHDILSSFGLALRLIGGGDDELRRIVALSLEVSLASALLACALGLPLGGLVAVREFPGRRVAIVAMNALLGLPSVVAGLVVYLLLSRAGPLGSLGILFTPGAIVVAQTLLVLPIVAALARQFVEDAWREYREQLTSLGVSPLRAVPTLLWDLRLSLLTVVLAGFGRAASEVGAVMIVGGNIDGVTRVMTTAIALETTKGDLPLALALGVILLAMVLALNAAAYAIREWSAKHHG